MHRVTGTVKPHEHYRILAVGPGKTPRVFHGTVKDRAFTIHLPAGACRLIIGTADGARHEHAITVDGPATADIPLK